MESRIWSADVGWLGNLVSLIGLLHNLGTPPLTEKSSRQSTPFDAAPPDSTDQVTVVRQETGVKAFLPILDPILLFALLLLDKH
jgi:hypothetical protein